MHSVLAIIPARETPTTLIDENLRNIGGWSLLRYSIEAAYDITSPSLVYVAGCEEKSLEEAQALGSKTLKYPEGQFQPIDQDLDLLKYCLNTILEKNQGPAPEYAVLLLPDHPFRLREDLQKACNLINSSLHPDFVVSVKPLRDKVSWPENSTAGVQPQKLVVNAGSFYFFKISAFLQEHTLIGKNTVSVTLSAPELEATVKTQEDFLSAQALFKSISSRLDFKPFQSATPDSYETEKNLSISK